MRWVTLLCTIIACMPPPSPLSPTPAAIRYVAIGASDAVGVGASDPRERSWPALLRARLPNNSSYTNLGVSGSTLAQAIAEQLPQAQRQRADVITVWLAVNDLNGGVPPSDYATDLARLLDGLRPTTARVLVGNVPDLTRVPAYDDVDRAVLSGAVATYNDSIRRVVASRDDRVTLVDLFTRSDVIAREVVVSADGFHPNDRGYELIAERFAETMRAAGVPVR